MMRDEFEIDGRIIGPSHPTYIVAELSANHGHDFPRAKAMVEAAAEAGADAIKLQTYTPDTLTIECNRPEFRINSGTIWDGRSLYDLYNEAFTPWEWQPELRAYALDLGLGCFSSPFDNSAISFLEQADFPAYKISSFEMIDIPLVRQAVRTGKPIIISTGMSSIEEIKEVFDALCEEGGEQLAFLKCTSAYPSPPEQMNLKTIPNLCNQFGVQVGLSDHTLGSLVSVAAVALGATIIEKHFTLSRSAGGPDSLFSMEPEEFTQMVKDIRLIEKAMGSANYCISEAEKVNMNFRRSIFIVEDINAGDLFTEKNIRSIRPANGLHPRYLERIIGRTAKTNISRGVPLTWSHISD